MNFKESPWVYFAQGLFVMHVFAAELSHMGNFLKLSNNRKILPQPLLF
jgi:hypothetical protein